MSVTEPAKKRTHYTVMLEREPDSKGHIVRHTVDSYEKIYLSKYDLNPILDGMLFLANYRANYDTRVSLGKITIYIDEVESFTAVAGKGLYLTTPYSNINEGMFFDPKALDYSGDRPVVGILDSHFENFYYPDNPRELSLFLMTVNFFGCDAGLDKIAVLTMVTREDNISYEEGGLLKIYELINSDPYFIKPAPLHTRRLDFHKNEETSILSEKTFERNTNSSDWNLPFVFQ